MKTIMRQISFTFGNYTAHYNGDHVRFEVSGDVLRFANLLEISEYFGSKDIDINNYSKTSGCPTCDWGAEEFCDIDVYNVTKNRPEVGDD